MFNSAKIEKLYEDRLAEQKRLYEQMLAGQREQIIRYEMLIDAQAQDIRDLTDKALQKHGSTAVQPPKTAQDKPATDSIVRTPPIAQAIEEDEEDERHEYERVEQQRRQAMRERAAEVDEDDREELRRSAAQVEAEAQRV